jgi:hypothetical protein
MRKLWKEKEGCGRGRTNRRSKSDTRKNEKRRFRRMVVGERLNTFYVNCANTRAFALQI